MAHASTAQWIRRSLSQELSIPGAHDLRLAPHQPVRRGSTLEARGAPQWPSANAGHDATSRFAHPMARLFRLRPRGACTASCPSLRVSGMVTRIASWPSIGEPGAKARARAATVPSVCRPLPFSPPCPPVPFETWRALRSRRHLPQVLSSGWPPHSRLLRPGRGKRLVIHRPHRPPAVCQPDLRPCKAAISRVPKQADNVPRPGRSLRAVGGPLTHAQLPSVDPFFHPFTLVVNGFEAHGPRACHASEKEIRLQSLASVDQESRHAESVYYLFLNSYIVFN